MAWEEGDARKEKSSTRSSSSLLSARVQSAMASDFLVGGERGVVTVVATPIDGRHLLSGLGLPQRVQQLGVGSRTYTCTVNERVDIVGGCSRLIARFGVGESQ